MYQIIIYIKKEESIMSNVSAHGSTRAQFRDEANQQSSQDVSDKSDTSSALQQAKTRTNLVASVYRATGFGEETQKTCLAKLTIR